MTYQKTNRKGILLCLLDIITMGIFFVFYMKEVREEIGSFGKKKGMPYWFAYLLGLITFLIVPLVWFSNRADAIREKADELNLDIKKTSFDHAYLWSFFGAFIIVGPFIATKRFFDTLNAVEKALNEPAVELPSPTEEENPEEKPEEKIEEEADVIKEIANKEKTAETPSVSKPERDPRIPKVSFDPKYAGVGAKTWTVKVDGRVHFFYRQSEAIAFAQRVAREHGVNVVVKGKKD